MEMDAPATTRAGGTKNLISQDDEDEIEPDNEDEGYMKDATRDANYGRKNSLMQMENDFQFQNNFEDDQYQENAAEYVDIDNFDGVNMADNLQDEMQDQFEEPAATFQINSPVKEFVDSECQTENTERVEMNT